MAPSILLRNGTVLQHDSSDHVTSLRQTDLLVEGDKISAIGKDISAPEGTEIIDCTDKIISPGFIDTHHHLWQTQLTGLNVDHSLFDYVPTGNLQSYNYTPDDTFWGELTGALEAIDGGTTYVLDHAHGCYTTAHIKAAVDALVSSGLRTGFAYATPIKLDKWDQATIIPSQDPLPEGELSFVEELAKGGPIGEGRVKIAIGFDAWYLPKDVVLSMFSRFQKAGVELFTTHITRNILLKADIHLIDSYGLLESLPNFVWSHCTGFNDEERALLAKKQVAISATPETEAPMYMGWPVLFEPGLNTSVGVDCHTSNTSFIPSVTRTGLILSRMQNSLEIGAPIEAFPKKVRADSEKAFNVMTIQGAKAVGLEKEIGSLQVGKKADLIVFGTSSISMSCAAENDPLAAVVRYSSVQDVELVVIDGKVRKRNGKLVAVDVSGERVGGKDGVQKLELEAVKQKILSSQREVIKRGKESSVEKARELMMGMFSLTSDSFKDIK